MIITRKAQTPAAHRKQISHDPDSGRRSGLFFEEMNGASGPKIDSLLFKIACSSISF